MLEKLISSHTYPNFPKDGVKFLDIFPVFNEMSEKERFNWSNWLWKQTENYLSAVVESRAFIFAGTLFYFGNKFFPIRKEGKLPGDVVKFNSIKEYGSDVLEFRKSDIAEGSRVVVLDDVLATGGTAKSIYESLSIHNIKVSKFVFFIEIKALNGRKLLETLAPVESYIKI